MSPHTSFSSVDPSWTARELSGGILSPLRRNGSKRRKRTGARGALRRGPATLSSFPCRSKQRAAIRFGIFSPLNFQKTKLQPKKEKEVTACHFRTWNFELPCPLRLPLDIEKCYVLETVCLRNLRGYLRRA